MRNGHSPLCGKPTTAELAAVETLWASAFAVPARPRARWLSPQRVRVVRRDGRVQGACNVSLLRLATAQGVRSCVWLRALAVSAEARGQGLGGALVQHVVQQAQAVGMPVALRSPERTLYARTGLQPVGRVYGVQLQLPAHLPVSAVAAHVHTGRSLTPVQVEHLALQCARAHQGWVPLPGKSLRAVLQQRACLLRTPDGALLAACAQAREGVPWLAAPDVSSAMQLLRSSAQATLRVDAYAPWSADSQATTLRELGPWWCSDATWTANLPASVLSCLD